MPRGDDNLDRKFRSLQRTSIAFPSETWPDFEEKGDPRVGRVVGYIKGWSLESGVRV